MANYQNLKNSIAQVIKANDNQEITGQLLRNTLNSIVTTIGDNYTFAGVATPSTNPGTPDQNVFYIVGEGQYINFGNKTVLAGNIGILKYNGTWSLDLIKVGGDVPINELNISKMFPTGGVGSSNKYTLVDAISKIPNNYKNIIGLKITFLSNDSNSVETYTYQGGTFTSTNSWENQIKRKEITKIQNYAIKKGIAGNVNFSSNIDIKKQLDSACVIIETLLLDKDFRPESYTRLGSIIGRSITISPEGYICISLNSHGSHIVNTKTDKISVTVANRDKLYDSSTAIIWSDNSKKYITESQYVLLPNADILNISILGHEKVAIGDIIILGRKLKPYEIPIAYKNPRLFLNDAVVFFPKEKYTETYAVEVCSNTVVNFKNNGTII